MNTIHFDSNGLIWVPEDDGTKGYGDCCAETMRYHHLLRMRSVLGISNKDLPYSSFIDLRNAYYLFRTLPGILMRGPWGTLPEAWGDPVKDFSRDQTDPTFMALGHNYTEDLLDEMLKAHRKRFYFYQNKDLPTPQSLNIIRRAKGEKPSAVYDMGLWVTTLARCGTLPSYDLGLKKWTWGAPDDVEDDINLIHALLQAGYCGHTWVSKAAMKKYALDRTVTEGTTKLGEKNKIMGAIALYYSEDNPGLIDVYRPIIEKLF